MKTLWIVNQHAALPTEAIAGARHFFLGEALTKHGWQSVIIGSSVPHGGGDRRIPAVRLQATRRYGNVLVRWLGGNRYDGNGLGRLVNMAWFTLLVASGFGARRLPSPDAVIGSSVHPLAAAAAWVQAKRFGVPFIFEIRDLWPETLIQMGALPREGLPARLLFALERWLCDRAVKVITTMPLAVDYLSQRGVDRRKIAWISNGVEPTTFGSPPARNSSLDEPFTFTYFGSIGQANGLSVLLEGFAEACRRSPERNRRLRMVGEGPQVEQLRSRARELGLSKQVTLEGRVPKQALPHVAAGTDAFVLAVLPLPLYDYGISLNKLYEYMLFDRPILFAGAARGNPLADSGGALVVGAKPDEIATAVLELESLSVDQRRLWGQRNSELVRAAFTYEVLGAALADVLAASCEASGSVRGGSPVAGS